MSVDEQNSENSVSVEEEVIQNPISYLKEIFKVLIISLLIIVPVRLYLFQPFIVEGDSMLPNFHNREYLIVDEISYRFNEPERGDVVIFHPPDNPKTYYIKRIIGLPGEGVEMKGGKIYIYNKDFPTGTLLPEVDYLPQPSVRETVQVDLKYDQYYVLGDNRNNSSDSRVFGAITKEEIRGKAFLRAFPFDKFTIFKPINYLF
jgi:signal peptidase I